MQKTPLRRRALALLTFISIIGSVAATQAATADASSTTRKRIRPRPRRNRRPRPSPPPTKWPKTRRRASRSSRPSSSPPPHATRSRSTPLRHRAPSSPTARSDQKYSHVVDALASVPGLAVVTSGAPGQATSVLHARHQQRPDAPHHRRPPPGARLHNSTTSPTSPSTTSRRSRSSARPPRRCRAATPSAASSTSSRSPARASIPQALSRSRPARSRPIAAWRRPAARSATSTSAPVSRGRTRPSRVQMTSTKTTLPRRLRLPDHAQCLRRPAEQLRRVAHGDPSEIPFPDPTATLFPRDVEHLAAHQR